MMGKLSVIVIDCPDPKGLAEFYSQVLGKPITGVEDDWVDLAGDETPHLAFQLAPDHVPPQWPDPKRPQQFHLDIDIERADLPAAEAKVLALGATKLPGGGDTFTVYADPAGHPFCFCYE